MSRAKLASRSTFVVACQNLTAGPNLTVEQGADVRLQSGKRVAFKSGFKVKSGAKFKVTIAPPSPLTRTLRYTYQDVQYYLTRSDGPDPSFPPWESLTWTYDKIGNRLTETRAGEATEEYLYQQNGTANPPILTEIRQPPDGGVLRTYTYGPAGHLEEVDASGNVVDFTSDTAGRLANLARPLESKSTDFTYDGRSFLTKAETPLTPGPDTATTEPTYTSEGLLMALHRQPSPSAPVEDVSFLYFAGRPVAQLLQVNGTSTYTYLTTDHLGSPLLATTQTGDELWHGPFEPFGADPFSDSAEGAMARGLFLRFPGQWEDEVWKQSVLGADVVYNLWRWYEWPTGRFTRPDPLGLINGDGLLFGYGLQNTLSNTDPDGLISLAPGHKCKGFRRAKRKLRKLVNECSCVAFFATELDTDLSGLIRGVLPRVKVDSRPRDAATPCRTEPGVILINPKWCQNEGNATDILFSILLHELAHFADCEKNRFPAFGPREEGIEAEKACLGFSLDSRQ